MSTPQTSLSILGIKSVDGKVTGTTCDGAKRSSKPQYRSADNAVTRVSGETDGQAKPTSDLRRGGRIGSQVTITEDTTVDHDLYMGRGTGKKTVDGRYEDR